VTLGETKRKRVFCEWVASHGLIDLLNDVHF